MDAIVSNPPYVPSAQVDRLAPKVRDHEPRLALDGGADGMDVLRDLCENASMLLAPEGELYLEIDAESGQAAPLSALLRELGFDPVRTHRDLSGADRFLSASLSLGVCRRRSNQGAGAPAARPRPAAPTATSGGRGGRRRRGP